MAEFSKDTGARVPMPGEGLSHNTRDKNVQRSREETALYTEMVTKHLKSIYRDQIYPVEKKYLFEDFHSAPMLPSDFEAKPMVLLLGQYSVGKTTFIRYLLGRDFPGQRIGPEPTTDRFVAIMNSEEDAITPGNALCVQADRPFRALTRFGNGFLSKFESSECNAEILDDVILIDTPGILSGEKQRLGRSYDFVQVISWFAERADMILLLFDAHKLDISDEFKLAIESLKGQDDKIRVVLNKADQVDQQRLMRVYGALMWAMGKVIATPEVVRVYIGSFWEKEYQFKENTELFRAEQRDLMHDIHTLPRYAAIRKVNELVKRARLLKTHAFIIGHLREEMPLVFGKDAKQAEMIKNLRDEFIKVQRQYRIPAGDFPDIPKMRENLKRHKFREFPKIDARLIRGMDEVLSVELPRILQDLSSSKVRTMLSNRKEEERQRDIAARGDAPEAQWGAQSSSSRPSSDGWGPPTGGSSGHPSPHQQAARSPMSASGDSTPNPFDDPPASNPFDDGDSGANPFDDAIEEQWLITNEDLAKHSLVFSSLDPINGKISGSTAREVLMQSNVPTSALRQIWQLSDIDRDGHLDLDEFCVAMYLIDAVLRGENLPQSVPPLLMPPSKR